MAIAVIGLDAGATPALLTMVGAYAVANLAAFAVVADLRGRTALTDYSGLLAARPVDAVVLALAFLSLVGIPPTVGFFGKFTVFGATIGAGSVITKDTPNDQLTLSRAPQRSVGDWKRKK